MPIKMMVIMIVMIKIIRANIFIFYAPDVMLSDCVLPQSYFIDQTPWVQLFFTISLRREQSTERLIMRPRSHRWEATELGFEPRSAGTPWWMNTLPQFTSCFGAPEAEQKHVPWSPLSAKSPCPLPVLRTSWEEERREIGGTGICSDWGL